MSRDVVLLLSGGLDSRVLLEEWRDRIKVALFVDYGHAAAQWEWAAAYASTHPRTHVQKVELGPGLELGRMAYVEGTQSAEVPARNAALIAIAVNRALAAGVGLVWIGANADDASEYPDCSREYLWRLSAFYEWSHGVKIEAPLLHMSRHGLARWSVERGHDLSGVVSCYRPMDSGEPCRSCYSCVRK